MKGGDRLILAPQPRSAPVWRIVGICDVAAIGSYALIVISDMKELDPFGSELPGIETQRLRMRHPRFEDAADLFAIFGDPVAMRYWSHEPHSELSVSQEYIAGIHKGLAERTLFQWAITLPENDRLVGTVTLIGWDRAHRRAELGYMLKPTLWGNGYASEAVRGVLRFGIDRMNLYRVEAELDPRNTASARLLERLGFKDEGLMRQRWFLYDEWCDGSMYGLLTDDFASA